MSKIKRLPPNAEKMIYSMRALGYSFQTALADVIDNSISAGATRVDILTPASEEEEYLAILDNGCGMDENTLIESMRHASKNPNEDRTTTDLGRFGLGMKTASLSQCRELLVVTRTGKGTFAAGWSIDTIRDQQDWALTLYDKTEYELFPCYELFNQLEHGTLLIWRQFDTLKAKADNVLKALTTNLADARDHLGLIYHRFITDEDRPIIFTINGRVIEPKDPFLENRVGGTDSYPTILLYVDGFPQTPIMVTGYTLPHQNKISNAQMATLGLKERSFGEDQGFYIYRGKRLIFWGGWLRMRRKAQASKLCRVCVDVPNSMDKIWDLDIKKSIAIPPKVVKDGLFDYLSTLISKSERIQSGKGTIAVLTGKAENPVWNACEVGDNRFAVRLNKECSLYKELIDSMDAEQRKLLNGYLGMLELYYPTRWVSAQYSVDKSSAYSDPDDNDSKGFLKEVINNVASDITTSAEMKLFMQLMLDNAELGDNKQLTETVFKDLKIK